MMNVKYMVVYCFFASAWSFLSNSARSLYGSQTWSFFLTSGVGLCLSSSIILSVSATLFHANSGIVFIIFSSLAGVSCLSILTSVLAHSFFLSCLHFLQPGFLGYQFLVLLVTIDSWTLALTIFCAAILYAFSLESLLFRL